MSLSCRGGIPNLKSAITLGGERGECVQIKLLLELQPDQIEELLSLREEVLEITLGKEGEKKLAE